MKSSSPDEIPSTKRTGLSPLLYVALTAAFLLLLLSFRTSDSKLVDLGLGSQAAAFTALSASQLLAAETPELTFVSEHTLKAATPPITMTPQVLGVITGKAIADIRPEVSRYIVEQGDTPTSLAEEFNVSVNTILWANDLTKSSTLKPGQQLVILPVTGALHLVRPNDTLSEIAGWYRGRVNDIVRFNSLASADSIVAGDLLVVPGGVQPSVVPQGRLTPIANSYFIYPVAAPRRITQGLHPFNAVDFSNGSCGESVYAAAGGTVQRTGYDAVGGNFVRILHPNGVVTYYGHFSAVLVSPGQKVHQGQIVGYTGDSGYTTGCHVHFEVRGAANPFR